MPTPTNRFNLNTYSQGETSWDHTDTVEFVDDEMPTATAEIDDTDSPYTTQGENQLEVDTSSGAVTVEIASADIPASGSRARPLSIFINGSNDVTLQTEGSELIQPGGASSLTISQASAFVEVRLAAGTVYVDRNKDLGELSTEVLGNDTRYVTGGGDETDIQAAIDALTSGRDSQETVVVQGDCTINDTITWPAYTVLDLRHAKLTFGDGDFEVDQPMIQAESDTFNSAIIGGYFYGNDSNPNIDVNNPVRGIEMITSSTGEDFGDPRNMIIGPSLRNFTGPGIYNGSRRSLVVGVSMLSTWGYYVDDTDTMNINVGVRGGGGPNNGQIYVTGSHSSFYHCWSSDTDSVPGILIEGGHNRFHDGYSENNADRGVQIGGTASGNYIVDMQFINNTGEAVYINGDRNVVKWNEMYDGQSTTTQTHAVTMGSNSAYNRIWGNEISDNPETYTDNGSWNVIDGFATESAGIADWPTSSEYLIGTRIYNLDDGTLWLRTFGDWVGGPWAQLEIGDPVDLTGATARLDGQVAIHDGTGTPPFGEAMWDDGNSQWVSQVDGSTFT